jgi:hypothetical protein
MVKTAKIEICYLHIGRTICSQFQSDIILHLYVIDQSIISNSDMKKILWGEAKQSPRNFA